MKGDFSKWDSDRRKNHRGVLHQQGRVLLDSDWNAQTSSMIDWQDQAAQDAIGPGVAGVPARTPDSFRVSGARVQPSGEVSIDIHPGRVWADGLLTYLKGRYDQPQGMAQRIADYFSEPIQDASISSGGISDGVRDAVVLEVWKEALNGFQVPDELIEPALGGPDTTERVHTASRLRLLRLEDGDSCRNISGKLATLPSEKGHLTVSLLPTTEINGDCPITEGGGYTGFEHHLYRLEIADLKPDVLASNGPMFKWSQFNGGLVGRGRCQFDSTQKKFNITANDQLIKMSGLSGFYLEVVEYDHGKGYWHVTYGANVSLNGDDLDVIGDEVYYSEPSLPTGTVFFRLWNGIEKIGAYQDATAGNQPNELRNGILLEFDGSTGTNYLAGDYWNFSVRAGDIETILAKFHRAGTQVQSAPSASHTASVKSAPVELQPKVMPITKGSSTESTPSLIPKILRRGEGKPQMPTLTSEGSDPASGEQGKESSKFLFSLDRKYIDLLSDGKRVDRKLRKAFDDNENPLARSARVSKVGDRHWQIPEETRTLNLKDDGSRLNVTNSSKILTALKTPIFTTKKSANVHDYPRLIFDQPPQGIEYHRVPLGILNWTQTRSITFENDEITDCRSIFHPLTKRNLCCSLTVGDGVSTFGDFDDLADAVRHLPDSGGDICLMPGMHRTNLLVENRKHITFRGCGHRSKVIPGDLGWDVPVFRIKDCQFITFENLEIDSIGGSAIVMEGTKLGDLQGVTIRNNWIMSCMHAIHITKGLEVNIRDNKIHMWDKQGGGAAIYISSEDVLIKQNTVSVIPPNTRPPLESIPSDVIHPDPSEPCADPTFIYANLTYLTVLVNFIWMIPIIQFIPLNPFKAPGGIQIASGAERVEIIENEIIGGAGNGITLGSTPDMNKLTPAPEVAPAAGMIHSINPEGRNVKFMVRSEQNEPVSGVVFSLSKGTTNHERMSSNGGFSSGNMGKGESNISVLSPKYRIKSVDTVQSGTAMSMASTELIKKITLMVADEEEEPDEALDFLYDIHIYGNTIMHMGLSGIGVPRVELGQQGTGSNFTSDGMARGMTPSNSSQSLSMALGLKFGVISGYVVNLSIQKNQISECLKNSYIPATSGELIGRGVGGISLGFCENVLIHENRIENNGTGHHNPVCGIFVFYGNQVDVSHNFIIDNGAVPTDLTQLRNGMWGGISMIFTTSLTRIPDFTQYQNMITKGGHAARVHGNVVDQPVGRPLTVGALGPVSIVDNLFNSEITAPGVVNSAVGGALILNLGGGFKKVMDFLGTYRDTQAQQTPAAGMQMVSPVMMYAARADSGGGTSGGGSSRSSGGPTAKGFREYSGVGGIMGDGAMARKGADTRTMGGSVERISETVEAAGASSQAPLTVTFIPAALALQVETVNHKIPNGNTLFQNNQTRLGPQNRSVISQLILTADDLGFSGNQSDIMSTAHKINTLLGGITLRAGDSRFKEQIIQGQAATKASLLSITKLLNNTHNNQGNHCIIATSLMEAINPYLGYRHSEGNQVMFPAKEHCPTIQAALSSQPLLLLQILTNLIGGVRK
jgi:hypothetical protein